jgi:DNA invertase Pin-like site-specific DNA recombinase
MAVIGYARVSTRTELDLQLTALQAAALRGSLGDNGGSGSMTERPQLSKAMERLEAGDVLNVWKLDRLGRNTRHVLDLIDAMRERGVGFRSLTEGLGGASSATAYRCLI